HLLGAVYGDEHRDPDGPSVPVEPPAAERAPDPPEWADDAHLDAAFADWTPGPPDGAPAAERAVVADADPGTTGTRLADDIAAGASTWSAALTPTSAVTETQPAVTRAVSVSGSSSCSVSRSSSWSLPSLRSPRAARTVPNGASRPHRTPRSCPIGRLGTLTLS